MKALSDKLHFSKAASSLFLILSVTVSFISRLLLLENTCSCRFGGTFSIAGGREVSDSGDDLGARGRGSLHCLCCVVDGGKSSSCDRCDSKRS